MVATAGTVEIGVGLDFARLRRDMHRLRQEMQTFDRRASRSFSNSARSISTMDRAAKAANRTFVGLTNNVKLLATAMGLLAVYGGTRAFAGFEATMNTVQAVSEANISQFELLNQKARELGSTTKFTASEVAGAMQFMAMAGLNVNEIYNGVGATLKLAAAGNMDLATSADIVTNVMTSMGLNVSDLNRAVDVLANAFVTANTNLTELGVAFTYAAPNASTAGISFEETAAALALMGNSGVKASTAGTSLRGAIQRLLGPTPQAEKAMKRLGLEVFTADGRMKSLVDIVRQLEPVIKRGAASVDDLVTIFGTRAFVGVAALAKQGADALEVQIGKIKRSGTAGKVAEVQMRGLSGSFKELQAAAEGLAISLGESGLGKAIEVTVRATARLLRILNQFVKASAPLQEQAVSTIRESYEELNKQIEQIDKRIEKFKARSKEDTWFSFLGSAEATVVILERRRKALEAQAEPMSEFIRLQQKLAESGKKFRAAVEQVGEDDEGLPPGFGQFDQEAANRKAALQKLQALESEYLASTRQNRRLIEVEYQRELDKFKELLDKKLISQQQYEEARAQLTILAAQRMDELNKQASETLQSIGQAISSNLESAFRSFIETGKLDFKELAKSIIADLAMIALRIAILKPLIDSITGGIGGVFGSVLHEGGIVGSSGSKREVPTAAFIGAPRLHNGGKLLARDEVPIIAQRGERILKKGQKAIESSNISNVSINISTPNPQAFAQSRVQVASQIAKAVALGQRGL